MMWLSQIAQWTGGTLQGDDLKVNAVATDTRAIEPGCLFAAYAVSGLTPMIFWPRPKPVAPLRHWWTVSRTVSKALCA